MDGFRGYTRTMRLQIRLHQFTRVLKRQTMLRSMMKCLSWKLPLCPQFQFLHLDKWQFKPPCRGCCRRASTTTRLTMTSRPRCSSGLCWDSTRRTPRISGTRCGIGSFHGPVQVRSQCHWLLGYFPCSLWSCVLSVLVMDNDAQHPTLP